MKLEPTEAQRKAMLAWAQENNPWDPESFVDGLIAAANSIPEGAPVGTIARRPDGAFVAVRALAEDLGHYWTYTCVDHTVLANHEILWPDRYDADSWPVIYDPTRDQMIQEYLEWSSTQIDTEAPDPTEDEAPLLAEAASKPRVFYDPTEKTIDELHAEIDRLDKAEDRALRERDHWQETVDRILYTCSSEDEIGEWSSANDPVERFIELFKPVDRIDPTAQQEPEGFAAAQHKEYLRAKAEFDTIAPKPRTAVAQQEPEEPGPPSNAHIKLAKPPRTPRVVDRLGVDEQGSPWRELLNGWEWVYLYDPKTDRWQRQTPNGLVKRYKPGAEPHRRGPFIEWGDPS